MKSAMGLMVVLAFPALVLLWGCGEDEQPAAPSSAGQTGSAAAQEEPLVVKPMEEYREQAAEEITPENAERELERLERQIESELESGG
ncbi:MAG: hypothetical protein PVJ27_05065 [Candidatus Brocadiaceae bacterium]|jgi:hypothetical protein